jgi:3-phenylpropionate/trans-cinnamate dioxygenase ferredoxin subunit
MEWFDAGSASLLEGEYRTFFIGDLPVALYRVGDAYYAIEDICTHDGGELASGPVFDFEVECIRHGARFDLRTGACTHGPAYIGTRSLRTRVHAGRVWVERP